METDLDKLQGTWIVTGLQSDGKKMPSALLTETKIVIAGNKFTTSGMGAPYKGTIQLDTERKPKAIDLSFTAGHAKGVTQFGIYKLRGERWTLCLATVGTIRPKAFTATGEGVVLEELERQTSTVASASKKAKKPELVATTNDKAGSLPKTQLEGEWQMISAVFNGEALDEAMTKWCKRVTRGNTTRVVAGPQVFLNVKFELESGKNKNYIRYSNLTGEQKGKDQLGIFELQRDLLKVCMSPPGKPRPKEFSSRPGDHRSFTIWRLVKS